MAFTIKYIDMSSCPKKAKKMLTELRAIAREIISLL
jgi:hypothetical protein